jgi:hypothetical protein
MVAPSFGKQPSELTDAWFRKILVEGRESGSIAVDGVKGIREGRAQGPLVGGCLTLVCSSLGTPYEVETDGAIVLLEDIDEAPYRIDRMLTQLKAASKFQKARGVIFGKMPGCQPPSQSSYTLDDVIRDVLGDQLFPDPVRVSDRPRRGAGHASARCSGRDRRDHGRRDAHGIGCFRPQMRRGGFREWKRNRPAEGKGGASCTGPLPVIFVPSVRSAGLRRFTCW